MVKKRITELALTLFCGLICLAGISGAEAAETAENDAGKKPEINVSADRLVSDRNKRYAEFSGDVVATREGARLTCDRLKIFYLESDSGSEQKQSGAVEKMIAVGNVRLTFENKVAVAERAVYTSGDDSIVLTGGKPRVTTGSSYVAGERITLNRSSGRVLVDSGTSTRVKAEFHPADKEQLGDDKE